MKKFLLSASVLVVVISSASAADMVQPYTKAPPMILVTNWTGFYLGAGAGYGIWNADQHNTTPLPSLDFRTAGRGFFGTASGGYDWQLSPSWVVGLFGDVQFGDL